MANTRTTSARTKTVTWERLARSVTVPLPMPVDFLVREDGSGRFEAKTDDLGTPVHVVAPTREKALERLERLVTVALERLVAERARVAS